jgi:outer membrane protein assembly factor BamB
MTTRRFLPVSTIVLTATVQLIAADWPQYRGPNRDAVSTEKGLRSSWPAGGPPLLWTFDKTGVGYAGSAVVGDRLYTSGGRGDTEFVMALDLKNFDGGKPRELWAVRIGPLFTWKGNQWNQGPNVTPTVDGELVYALGGQGDLVCVEAATGKERWRKNLPKDFAGEVNPIGGGAANPTPLGWGYAGAPLVDGDQLICAPGGKQGLLAALDKKSGNLLWQSKVAAWQTSYSSPIAIDLGGIRQYVQLTNKGLAGIAAKDGKLLWQYQRDPAYDDVVIATPIYHDGYFFLTAGFGEGCDLVHVKPQGSGYHVESIYAKNQHMVNRDGGVVRIGDHVYGYSEGAGWTCLDFKKGEVVWYEKRKLGRGSLTFADGHFYCVDEQEGIVVLLEATPKGWNEHGRLKLPQASKSRKQSGMIWTHPVIANGRLYLRDQELLFCYDIRASQ